MAESATGGTGFGRICLKGRVREGAAVGDVPKHGLHTRGDTAQGQRLDMRMV